MGPRLRIKVKGRKAISNLKSPRMFPTPQQGERDGPESQYSRRSISRSSLDRHFRWLCQTVQRGLSRKHAPVRLGFLVRMQRPAARVAAVPRRATIFGIQVHQHRGGGSRPRGGPPLGREGARRISHLDRSEKRARQSVRIYGDSRWSHGASPWDRRWGQGPVFG